jgi:hypothetical protein
MPERERRHFKTNLPAFQNFERLVNILFILLILSTSAPAMDRWTALPGMSCVPAKLRGVA